MKFTPKTLVVAEGQTGYCKAISTPQKLATGDAADRAYVLCVFGSREVWVPLSKVTIFSPAKGVLAGDKIASLV